jgi:hypothetical protein
MNSNGNYEQPDKSRVLLFSNRNLYDHLVWRCPFREFERILTDVEAVDVLAPNPGPRYQLGRRIAMKLGEYAPIPLNPGVPETRIEKEYDLFITVPERVSELLHMKSLKGLRDKCKKSICWLPEFYYKDIPVYKSCVEILKEFDYVVFMYVASDPFLPYIKGHSQYLPAGIDNLNFSPYPNPPQRVIDVLSIGRRAPATHKALLQMAKDDNKFYMYDTINALKAHDLDEHRLMTANMAKRSRYFIVSPGKFDKPEETGGTSEFGYRYFEAGAAGTVMIGMRPYNNKEFDKIFTWPDAVLEVPFTSGEIVDVIHEFDKQPERQARVRARNMTECLLHHDWVYRWESILEMVGMQPLPKMQKRKNVLKEMAAAVENDYAQKELSGVR